MVDDPSQVDRDAERGAVASWLKPLLLVLFTLAVVVVYWLEVPFFRGPWYWRWKARDVPVWPLAAWMGLIGIAWLAILAAGHWRRFGHGPHLLGLMVCMFAATLALEWHHPLSDANLQRVPVVVQDNIATSYYYDAARLRNFPDKLVTFTELMPTLQLHSKTHPPGPVLYFMAYIYVWGPGHTSAMISGILLGALATLVVPACYFMLRCLRVEGEAALLGAGFMVASPSLVHCFPGFDPTYAVLTCLMIATWVRALERRSTAWAMLFGLSLAVAVFFAYNMLVLGAAIAMLGLHRWWVDDRLDCVGLMRHSGEALLACVLAYVALWAVTGFDPIATFLLAYWNQSILKVEHVIYGMARPYHATVWLDPIDFAKGVNWVAVPLVLAWCASRLREAGARDRHLVIAGILMGQVLIVTVTGLLAAEVVRVWAFMVPLFALPVAMELCRWSMRGRLVAMACAWVVCVVLFQKVSFG